MSKAGLIHGLLFAWALPFADVSPAQAGCDEALNKKDIPYSDRSPLTKLDVYGFAPAKKCGLKPVIVYVHGGAWQGGDKADLGHKVSYFRKDLGAVVVSVNYRLSPAVLHPAHTQDAADSIRWVARSISTFGGDPKRLTLVGWSAGGHMIALLGVQHRYMTERKLNPKILRCTIIIDNGVYLIEGLMKRGKPEYLAEMYRVGFGNSVENWRDGSPGLQVAQSRHPPATLLVTRGTEKRIRNVTEFASGIQAKGSYAEVFNAVGWSHDAVDSELGLSNIVTKAVTEFWRSKCR